MLLLTGVRASAAQNAPVNTICSQCGSVLAPGVHACNFCDSRDVLALVPDAPTTHGNLALRTLRQKSWRGELDERVEAYRSRRRKQMPRTGQSALPFDELVPVAKAVAPVGSNDQDRHGSADTDDFAFTIAIGRIAHRPEPDHGRLLIDVSVPPQPDSVAPEVRSEPLPAGHAWPFPVASFGERGRALLIDAACLLFAYGGFLALFSSLGGHFTLSKLSVAVCFFTFAFVYLQYFGLFTVFGGTTPGMMACGLHVASFTGDEPTPRQSTLRAAGYLLSAGSCFLGFLWVLWDEDGLSWHDRLSRTYLAPAGAVPEGGLSHPPMAR